MASDETKELAREDAYIFTNPSSGTRYVDTKVGWYAALRRAGLEGFRFHDTRHTFACRFLQRGGRLEQLQKILGHASIQTTMRYIHIIDDDLRKSMEALDESPTEKATSEVLGAR
jgi:integrase